MFTFVAAVFFLFITPGPGVMSIAGVGAGFGYRPALRYFLGLLVGSNLVGFVVIAGLATLLFSVPHVRTVLLIASAAYLLYLAARIAFAGTRLAFIEAKSAPGFWNGVMLQAINPKAYAVNTTFFTGFAFLPESLFIETLIKLVIINAIWVPIHILWLAAGVTLQRLDLPRNVHIAINFAMALSMLAVVALAAWAQTGFTAQ